MNEIDETFKPKMIKELKEYIKELENDWNGVKKQPFVNNSPKVKRNDPCPCNSGKKFKVCCLNQPKE